MNKIKIGSVIACVGVILICVIYYSRYVSETIYDLRAGHPGVESCSAGKINGIPEGYSFRYYGDYKDLEEMAAVEITWVLSNITNELMDMDDFRADYESTDGSYLYVMEKEEEDLAIPDYENRRVIPPGEQAVYTEYVLVPAGSHEIKAKPWYAWARTGDGEETFTVTF